jgi:hypothetical protein
MVPHVEKELFALMEHESTVITFIGEDMLNIKREKVK